MKNDKEFLTKIGFDMSEYIHWFIVINDNLMRYSFDTVRVNTHVRGGNTCQILVKVLFMGYKSSSGLRISQNFRLDLILHLAPVMYM